MCDTVEFNEQFRVIRYSSVLLLLLGSHIVCNCDTWWLFKVLHPLVGLMMVVVEKEEDE